MLLIHKQCSKNYFNELLSLSNDLNIFDFFAINVEQVKLNITRSRLLHEKNKYPDISRRIKYLKYSQQQHKITIKKIKRRHNLCSNIFGSQKGGIS